MAGKFTSRQLAGPACPYGAECFAIILRHSPRYNPNPLTVAPTVDFRISLRLDVWLTVTLFGCLLGGTVIYIVFRLFTYRKLPPDDSNDIAGETGAVFVRR